MGVSARWGGSRPADSQHPLPLRLALDPPTPTPGGVPEGRPRPSAACMCQPQPLAQCPLLASVPHTLLRPPFPPLSFWRCCNLPRAGVRVPPAATPPPPPCWTPPFGRAAWRDHRQPHEREFSQAEMELKATSPAPAHPCCARPGCRAPGAPREPLTQGKGWGSGYLLPAFPFREQ